MRHRARRRSRGAPGSSGEGKQYRVVTLSRERTAPRPPDPAGKTTSTRGVRQPHLQSVSDPKPHARARHPALVQTPNTECTSSESPPERGAFARERRWRAAPSLLAPRSNGASIELKGTPPRFSSHRMRSCAACALGCCAGRPVLHNFHTSKSHLRRRAPGARAGAAPTICGSHATPRTRPDKALRTFGTRLCVTSLAGDDSGHVT